MTETIFRTTANSHNLIIAAAEAISFARTLIDAAAPLEWKVGIAVRFEMFRAMSDCRLEPLPAGAPVSEKYGGLFCGVPFEQQSRPFHENIMELHAGKRGVVAEILVVTEPE